MHALPASPQLRRIRTVSLVLKWACAVGMIAPPLFTLGAIAAMHYPGTVWDLNGVPADGPPREPLLMDLEWVVGFLPAIALIWGLNQLRLLFSGFAEGRIFSADHATHLLRFGKALLVYAIACPLVGMATSTIRTIGEEQLKTTFNISTDDAQVALVGFFFYVLGWVFREGARLAEENAQIV